MRSIRLIVAVGLVVISTSAFADTIRLKDGTVISGTLRRVDRAYEVTDAAGKVRQIGEDEVVSIQRGAQASSAADQSSRLASHRKTIENLSDIDQIIARYETFIKQVEGTPVADEARADLVRWRERKLSGMVRVGRDWLTPAEAGKWDEQSFVAIDSARGLVKQNRTKEAIVALDKILDRDPENVGALYLKGLCLYRQDQIPAARRIYDQLADLMPGHGPSLNNLGVVQWRQNAAAAAMGSYLRAMQAMPQMTVIHDNVAEALNSGGRERDSVAGRKLVAQYAADEPRLEATMQQSGWYRWGATWVTGEQLRQLQEQEKQIRDQLDKLAAQFEDTQASIQDIDKEIGANERAMRLAENGTYVQDNNGAWVRTALPSRYYDLRDTNQRLEASRKRQLDRLDSIKRQAEDTRARMAVPAFTNQHKMMDEQYTPVRLRSASAPAAAATPQAAATEAATMPAQPAISPPKVADPPPAPVRAEPVGAK